jgi:hypothetical protein
MQYVANTDGERAGQGERHIGQVPIRGAPLFGEYSDGNLGDEAQGVHRSCLVEDEDSVQRKGLR